MLNAVTISIGRVVQKAAELRGGGSALPGLVVEKLDPHFATRVLEKLPLGVVLVSGTNGKTTTSKIVSELLSAAGLRVFTNNTGSNFMRGVISSLLRKVSLGGRLDADIAVLELDEAHAVAFAQAIKPRYSLLLNVMRDQLDRFGEIDYTADLLAAVARNTTGVVVLNREDRRIAALAALEELTAEVRWFGLAPELIGEFPEDDALYNKTLGDTDKQASTQSKGAGGQASPQVSEHMAAREASPSDGSLCANAALASNAAAHLNTAVLIAFDGGAASIALGGTLYEVQLALKGIYNVYNATAALALVHVIMPQTPVEEFAAALANVRPAFGRGECLEVEGQPLELVLIKNPGGFSLALKSYDPTNCATMIAINDEYADGRDMSWLYDVDFSSLVASGVDLLSGVRAYDMALRLEYDEVRIGRVERNLDAALEAFLQNNPNTPRRIYCTYTAMLTLRTLLAAKTEVEVIR